jgi:23S rRNA pseudouridine1911/1915/1917 synthase
MSLLPGQWNPVECPEGGSRLDVFLSQSRPELSRARVQKLVAQGFVRCNGKAAKSNLRLTAGDLVEVFLPPPRALDLRAQDIPLGILYQDEHLAVIEKPAGMVVHPSAGHDEGTLVNALLHHLENLSSGKGTGIGGHLRPGIVHRIDRNTSGILLVTKTDEAHRQLSAQFKEHSITRRYLGLCWGKLPPDGEWNEPIARDPKERKRMAIVPGGRAARTKFRLRKAYGSSLSLFEAELFTGRTHQIRVHFSAHGFPLAGDEVYGAATRSARRTREQASQALQRACPAAKAKLEELRERGRQFLHAAHLGFRHPARGDWLEFQSELPADLRDLVLCLDTCWPVEKTR